MFKEMPFGKHKGTPLPKLPKEYAEWLLSQEWVKGPLRDALEHRNDPPSMDRPKQHYRRLTRRQRQSQKKAYRLQERIRNKYSQIDRNTPNQAPSHSQRARQQDSHSRSNI